MKGAVRRRRQARQDLVHSFRHYAHEAGLGVARRFLSEAEATFGRLAGFPEMGRLYQPEAPALTGLRFFPLSGFREYLVFYRTVPSGVEVIRVLHSARDIGSILAADLDASSESETSRAGKGPAAP